MFAYGLAFLVPEMVPEVSAVELSMGRYLVYGALSAVLLAALAPARRRRLDRSAWRSAAVLGLAGNSGYYVVLVVAVQHAGAAVAALIVGALPVTLALAGSWRDRAGLRALAVPLVLTVVGLTLVDLAALLGGDAVPGRSVPLGIAAAVAALAAWTWFGVANARFLARRPDISPTTWTSALGVASAAWLLPAAPVLLLSGRPLTATARPAAFLAGALVLGVVTSWVATAAWNRAAVTLPVSLAGQLVVVETVVATAYSHLHRWSVPEPAVLAGAALLVSGALLAVRRTAGRRGTSGEVPASPVPVPGGRAAPAPCG